MKIPEGVLNWLLEKGNPSVRYRTLTDILQYDEQHPDVIEMRAKIPESRPVVKILSQIHERGEWPWVASYDAPEYGIGYLGELGMSRAHSKIHSAIEWYLSTQSEDGSFPSSYSRRKHPDDPQKIDNSCYYALTIRGLLKLGYQVDERIKHAIAFAVSAMTTRN